VLFHLSPPSRSKMQVLQAKYNSGIVAGEPSFKADRAKLGGTPSPTPLPLGLGKLRQLKEPQAPLLGVSFFVMMPLQKNRDARIQANNREYATYVAFGGKADIGTATEPSGSKALTIDLH
jgi:hypothetical protein